MEYLFLNARSLRLQPKATVSFLLSHFSITANTSYISQSPNYHSIFFLMLAHTVSNLSISCSHPDTSLFIHPTTTIISRWISSTRFRFQQIDSFQRMLCYVPYLLYFCFAAPGVPLPAFSYWWWIRFFMRVRKDTIISFPINFFASAFLDIKNHCIVTSNRNYTIQWFSIL